MVIIGISKKNGRRSFNTDLRDFNFYPIISNDHLENVFFKYIKNIDFCPYSFSRVRKFSFKSLFILVLSIVISGTYKISFSQRTFSNTTLFGIKYPQFTKQALFKRLKKVNPLFFKDILLNYFCNCTSDKFNLNEFGVSNHKLRQFTGMYKLDATYLDEMPKSSLISKHFISKRNNHLDKLGGIVLTCTNLITEKLHNIIYDYDARKNDLNFEHEFVSWFSKGDLITFDRGFNKHSLFDNLTEKGVFFIIPFNKCSSFKVIKNIYSDDFIQDNLISLGKNHTKAKHTLRMISICNGNKKLIYITNVLSVDMLNAKDIHYIYSRRWNIEKTFHYVKRYLNLSYLWSNHPNIIEIQVYVSFMVYNVVVDIIRMISKDTSIPQDRISFSKVKKSFFHFIHSKTKSLKRFLINNFDLLELFKPIRNYEIDKINLYNKLFSQYIF